MNGGLRKISLFFVPSTIVNMVAGHLTIMSGLRWLPRVRLACITSAMPRRRVRCGDADAMVAGGAEKASRPWDKRA